MLAIVTACGGTTRKGGQAGGAAGGRSGDAGAPGSLGGSSASTGGQAGAEQVSNSGVLVASTDRGDSTTGGGRTQAAGNSHDDCWGANITPDPDGGDACAAASCVLNPRPVDMYVIVDTTSSMGEDCPLDASSTPPPGSSTWCTASHGLAAYFTLAPADGRRAALQFMTAENYLCEGGTDNGHAWAAVPLSTLPVDGAHELLGALDEVVPAEASASAPAATESALRGIATFTSDNAAAHRSMVGVLIAGSDPDACSEDTEELSAIARDHLESTGIETFVIGLADASASLLEAIGEAGGAPLHGPEFCPEGAEGCHHFSVGDDDPMALGEVLEAIVHLARPACEYEIPEPPQGEALDPDLMNVQVTYPEGTAAVIPKISVGEACGARPGWHYDDPDAPTSIRLCEASCASAMQDDTTLLAAYGCTTIPFLD